jgi:PhoPQ-activated pathogenicity-related protein
MLSTNDRYWPLDALKLYWSELPEPKNVIYVPNQGHGLRDAARVIGALSAVHRYAAMGKSLPRTRWTFASTDDALEVRVNADRPVARVLVWSAESATKDFREARWTSRRCSKRSGGHLCRTERGDMQYTAVFAETSFKDENGPRFSTTTTVCIVRRDAKMTVDC